LIVLGVVALGSVMIALLAPAVAIGTPCSARGGAGRAEYNKDWEYDRLEQSSGEVGIDFWSKR